MATPSASEKSVAPIVVPGQLTLRTIRGKNGPFTPPRYSHVYNLRSVQEKNAKGEFANWEVTVHGLVEHKAHYIQAKTFADSVTRDLHGNTGVPVHLVHGSQ